MVYIEVGPEYTQETAWVNIDRKERFTGIYKEYYPNGKEWIIHNYIDGLEEGVTTYFMADGRLWRHIWMKNGIKHGREEWFDNKNLGKRRWNWMGEEVSKEEWERREFERVTNIELG
jgi:antitoxin component YwqK of YwqJK toxin-antitoxin module